MESARAALGTAPLLVLMTAAGCGSGAVDAGAKDELRIELVDVAAAAGIDVVNVSGDPRRWYIPESNGTGAAWLDYDGDGDVDLFVGNGCGLRYVDDGRRLEVVHSASSRLYRNEGGMRFTDVTDEAGARRSDWINGVATADADGDGDTDLYLACFGPDVYLRNEGGRFVDATAEAGLSNERWGASAAFGDADGDGDLDLFVANYCEFDLDAPPMGGARMVYEGVELGWGPEGEAGEGINPGAPNVYFRNEGGRFVEATAEAGFVLPKALCSYAAVWSDLDGDGRQDLIVANDVQPTSYFHNLGAGRFEEQGVARGFAYDARGEPTAAMGLAVDDVDGDGDLDVFRSNFDLEANCLHVNDGRGGFEDRAARHGLAGASMDRLSWGCGFFDVELDGDLDLLVANGHVLPQAAQIGMSPWAQRSQLFEAVPGPDGAPTWRDATERAGPGLAPLRSARGLALGDPDDDGDIDALIVDIEAPPRLLENRSDRKGRWLAVRLRGRAPNTDGYGARVTVHAGGRSWTREMRTTGGLYSAHDPRLSFGLGPVEAIERVEVRWPAGRVQTIESPAPDRLLEVREPEPAPHEEVPR